MQNKVVIYLLTMRINNTVTFEMACYLIFDDNTTIFPVTCQSRWQTFQRKGKGNVGAKSPLPSLSNALYMMYYTPGLINTPCLKDAPL